MGQKYRMGPPVEFAWTVAWKEWLNSMVYGYNYIVNGGFVMVYKPTYNWGEPSCTENFESAKNPRGLCMSCCKIWPIPISVEGVSTSKSGYPEIWSFEASCLVVYLPLWKMMEWKSVGMTWHSQLNGKSKKNHVPNHQSASQSRQHLLA